MAKNLYLGNGNWATTKGSTLFYTLENGIYEGVPSEVIRNSEATTPSKDGLIETVDVDTSAIDYTYSANGALRLEDEVFNEILYSEDSSQWTVTGLTSSSSNILGVSGDFLFTENLLSSQKSIREDSASVSIGDYCMSYIVDVNDDRDYNIYPQGGSIDARAKINGQDGSLISSAGAHFVNAGSIILKNGKMKIYMVFNVTSSISVLTHLYLSKKGDASYAPTYTGEGASLNIGLIQLEKSKSPTSYIPTNGATGTRAADSLINVGREDLFNSSEGVWFIECELESYPVSSNRWISLSNGSVNEFISFVFTSAGDIQGRNTVGGGIQSLISYTIDYSNNIKIAFQWKENDFALWVNGVEVGTDTSGSVSSANVLNNLSYNYSGGGSSFRGSIKQQIIFKDVDSAGNLSTLTTL